MGGDQCRMGVAPILGWLSSSWSKVWITWVRGYDLSTFPKFRPLTVHTALWVMNHEFCQITSTIYFEIFNNFISPGKYFVKSIHTISPVVEVSYLHENFAKINHWIDVGELNIHAFVSCLIHRFSVKINDVNNFPHFHIKMRKIITTTTY